MNILYCANYFEGFNVLKRLFNEFNVIGVVTRIADKENNEIINFCEMNYINFFDEKLLKSKVFISKLKKYIIDLIVINNIKTILSKEIIEISHFGGINLHSSLLPAYKGRAPINWAMINDEKFTGITIHYIDDTIDGGNILLQKKIKIKNSDDYYSLLKKNIALEPQMFIKSIYKVKNGFKGFKQYTNNIIYPYISEIYRRIDWNSSSRSIFNLVRALVNPFPNAYTTYFNDTYKIVKVKETKIMLNVIAKPGRILKICENYIVVKAQPYNIRILELINCKTNETLKDLFILKKFNTSVIFGN